MQKVIYDEPYQAVSIINDYLHKGWRIVPDAVHLESLHYQAGLAKVDVWEARLLVVIEKQDPEYKEAKAYE